MNFQLDFADGMGKKGWCMAEQKERERQAGTKKKKKCLSIFIKREADYQGNYRGKLKKINSVSV